MNGLRSAFLICVLLTVYCEEVTVQCGTEMYTDKTVYRIGDTVHLNCSTTTSQIPDPAQFYIIHTTSDNKQGTNVSAIFNISGSVAVTDIKVNDVSDAGTYTCYYGNCPDILLTSFETLVVESGLSVPKLSCIWENYWNLTCHWGMTEPEVVREWRMMYTHEGAASYSCCVAPTGACDEFSVDTSCCISSGSFVPYPSYKMQLEALWVDNSTETYNYTVSVDNSILRCHIDAIAVSSGIVQQFNVTATSDCAPASVGGVTCHVTTVSQWEPIVISRICTSSSAGLTLNCAVDGLEPYTKYNLSMACRPNDSSFWSNTLVTMATTLAEPPVTSPEVIGYSEKVNSETSRDIVLYLKPMSQRQRSRREAKITVQFKSNSKTVQRVFDAGVSAASLNGSFQSVKTYTLTITAGNENGLSANSTSVEIAKSETRPAVIVVDQTEHDGFEVLLFGMEQAVTQTCYYSCHVDGTDSPPLCQNALTRNCVDGFHHSYTMTVDPEDRSFMYRTAVGVGFIRDSAATEIFWSNCVFGLDYSKRPSVSVYGRRVSDSTVEVELNFLYCTLPQRPLVYQVEARAVSANHNCTFEDVENITASPGLEQIPLTVDPQYQEVVICFRAIYADDTYDIFSDATVSLEAASHPTQQKSSLSVQMGVGVSGGVTIVLLFILILALKKYQQRVKSRNLVADIIPNLNLPLNADSTYYTWLGDTEGTGSQACDGAYDTLQDGTKYEIPENAAIKDHTENSRGVVSETKRTAYHDTITDDQENTGQYQNNNHETTERYMLQISKGDLSFRNADSCADSTSFKTKESLRQKALTLVITQPTDGADGTREVSEIVASSENEATGSGASEGTVGGSQMDSYTILTCSVDSGQSVSDYVTTAEVTSYQLSSF